MRLIDADALHKFVEEEFKDDVPYEWAWALTVVDHTPTIDAVPVVRCGLCRYCDTKNCPMSGTPGSVSVSDFCSYGERRDDNA